MLASVDWRHDRRLDSQIRLKFPFSESSSIIAYINVLMITDTLWISQLFKDMTTVFEARLPAFWSVPPELQDQEELHLKVETLLECWLYVNSWHSHQNRTSSSLSSIPTRNSCPTLDVETRSMGERAHTAKLGTEGVTTSMDLTLVMKGCYENTVAQEDQVSFSLNTSSPLKPQT